MSARTASLLLLPFRLRPLVVLCALICAGLLVTGGTERPAPSSRAGLDSLPMAVQGPVSAALGRELAAYRVSRLAAHNPEQHFDVRFSPMGATVLAGTTKLGIALSAYGYGDALRRVAPVAPRADANRVSYAYDGLTAWWVNGPLGLEQGFDLAARPPAGAGPLTLSLAISGGLEARPDHDAIAFSGSGLSYGGLFASDALGHELPSHLRLDGDRIVLSVDDRSAVYPLRIDPILRESARLIDSHGARNDQLSWSVATSGDTIVVGAPFHAGHGKALVFVKPPSGWAGTRTQSATLTAGGPAVHFGWSVAVSGRTVVVGAPGPYAAPGVHPVGAAYVFVRPKAGWSGSRTPTATLTPSTLTAGDVFGDSVAVSGDTVVASAPGHAVGSHAGQGVVHVFVKPRSGWAGARRQAATLVESDGRKLEAFGMSLSVSGDTVVVGAFQHRISRLRLGGAYVFTRPHSGWSGTRHEAAVLRSSYRIGGSGYSVGVSGDTIVVGTGAADNIGPTGTAFVYVRPAAGWHGTRTQSARLMATAHPVAGTCGIPPDDDALQAYGYAVAISGDRVVVTAGSSSSGGHHFLGKACVFAKPPSGWAGKITDATTLTPSTGVGRDLFGTSSPQSASASGDTVVISSAQHKVRSRRGAGAAFVY